MSRSGWLFRVSLFAAIITAWICASRVWAATFTWNAAGDGNWSDTSKWTISGGTDADGVPDQDDDIIIPDAAGNRTITLDATPGGYGAAYWRYRSLAISQFTAGATNRLLFNNDLRMDNSEYQMGTSFNAPAGTVIMDTGGYTWEWNSMTTGGTRTFGSNVIINAAGGSKQNQRSWHDQPTPVIQGTVNITGSTVTAFLSGGNGTNILDNGSVLCIAANGALNSARPFDLRGTITGDGTGGLRIRGTTGATRFPGGASLGSQLKLMSGTIVVEDGAYFNGRVHLNADDFDYCSASPNTVLTNLTIAPNGGGGWNAPGAIGSAAPYQDENGYGAPSPVEVTANADTSTNWGIHKLTFKRLNMDGSTFSDRGALMLTDRHGNDPLSAAKEFMLVNFVDNGLYENLYLSDATRGYDLHVNGAVSNWTKLAGLHLDTAGSQSTVRFLVPGGGLNLAQNVYVSSGATLRIEGPASVSLDWLKFTSGGTFDFEGTNFMAVYNYTPGTGTVESHGYVVYGAAEAKSTNGAASGARLVIKGSLQTGGGNLTAGGQTRIWTNGAPVVGPPSRIDIQGDYLAWVWNNEGERITGQFNLGRKAVISVTGNFTHRQFHEGNTGDSLTNNWWVDQSPDCGLLVFNGGGLVTQTWETMSSVATVFTGLNFYAQSAAPAAGTTIAGATSGASATVVKVSGDLLKLADVSGTFAADEILNFSDGKTARAYSGQSVRPDLTDNAYPYPTVSIGEEGGSPAYVRLVNAYNHRRYTPVGASAVQIERNLIVTTGATFDLGALTNILCAGEGTVRGLVTNSVSGGTMIITNGALLTMGEGGIVDVDSLALAADSRIVFAKGRGAYIRVDGDRTSVFESHIVAGRLMAERGVVKALYTPAEDHTRLFASAAGTVFVAR